ncbi:MAG: 4Fe-4S dicluster domain-containing protein, partial [Deltaproteobacteria bacterium]|nr:4Fe-4S dicluster domain-containing protein [Deltaproteobacteria bacterium]
LCAKLCPADAIRMVEELPHPAPRIDRTRCIHCFMCQEACPEGAIAVGRGLVRTLIR